MLNTDDENEINISFIHRQQHLINDLRLKGIAMQLMVLFFSNYIGELCIIALKGAYGALLKAKLFPSLNRIINRFYASNIYLIF